MEPLSGETSPESDSDFVVVPLTMLDAPGFALQALKTIARMRRMTIDFTEILIVKDPLIIKGNTKYLA